VDKKRAGDAVLHPRLIGREPDRSPSLTLSFLHERFVNPLGVAPFFFESYHLMAGRLTPGWHILLDPLVIRHDLQHLTRHQFLDLLGSHDDGHWAEVPQRIQLYIGLNHRSFFSRLEACPSRLDKKVDASLLRLSQVGRDPGQLIHTVDQGILGNSHQPHGGGTGDELHAKILRSLN